MCHRYGLGVGSCIRQKYPFASSGERNFKLTSPRLHMSQNAYNTQVSPLVDPTRYASPLLTLSKHGYTKHYFEEGRRICSKIGGGFDAGLGQDIERPVGVISGSLYILHEQQRMSVQKTFIHDMDMEAGMEGVHDLSKVVMNHELGRDDPEPAFFYHSDHLGSAAYITDEYGQWTQMLNYLPYGEDWVERNRFNPADTTRLGIYRFNGKEKDYESGFHYYGARYYWSELLAGWLSVDPLADKYPSISPYNYCLWNPVKLVDPDGNEAVDDGWKVDNQNKTITRVNLYGGDNTQYVEGDGAPVRNNTSRGALLNEYKGYEVIDDVSGFAQLNPAEERAKSDAVSPETVAGTIVSGTGLGCNRMSKAIFDLENGTYMGEDGSTKIIQRGKNGGLKGRYKSQIKAAAKYAKFGRVCTAVGVVSSLASADNTEDQYRNGQISNAKRWTNHAVDAVGCTPIGWLAPIAYRLGENYGPSTWLKK